MTTTTLICARKCGEDVEYEPEEAGELKRCFGCGAGLMMPFESVRPTEAPSVERDAAATSPKRRIQAPNDENVPMKFPGPVPSAYTPSGDAGDLGTLVLAGVPGLGLGALFSGGCLAFTLILLAVHNALSVFLFILPVLILGVLAVSPGMFGFGVGKVIAGCVEKAKCRNSGVAGLIAFLWTSIGLGGLYFGAEILSPQGESFFPDVFLPFIRQLTAWTFTFDYLKEPDPSNVPAWMVYSVLGGITLLGVAASCAVASEKVCNSPFCERCKRYMKKRCLWSMSPVHGERAIPAFEAMNEDAIAAVPYCSFPENGIDVDVWGCRCEKDYYLELVGQATVPASGPDQNEDKREPVRIHSRQLSADELPRVERCGRGA